MRNLRIWVLCLFILLFVSGCSGRVSDVHIDLENRIYILRTN